MTEIVVDIYFAFACLHGYICEFMCTCARVWILYLFIWELTKAAKRNEFIYLMLSSTSTIYQWLSVDIDECPRARCFLMKIFSKQQSFDERERER